MTKKIPKTRKVCSFETCNQTFVPVRSTRIYCSKKCLNASKYQHRKIADHKNPKFVTFKSVYSRKSDEVFHSSQALTQMFYEYQSEQDRLDLCMEILYLASGGNGNYRRVLTAGYLIKPNLKKKKLFYNGSTVTRTIAEIINSLCFHMFGVGTIELLREKNFQLLEGCDGFNIPINSFMKRSNPFPHKYDPEDRQEWYDNFYGVSIQMVA
jgi:hypothetical protein